MILLRTVLKKKITCILYDLSYFVKITHIFQILQGVHKLSKIKS